MDRRETVTVGLVVVGIALLAVAFLATPDAELHHDTRVSFNDTVNYTEQSYLVVHYDNLSDRGQTVYRRALENDGEYSVDQDEGVPEFTYRRPATGEPGEDLSDQLRRRTVVVVRPNDSALPPARESIGDSRYDAMVTVKTTPDLLSPAYALPIAALVAGIISLVAGAYLRFAKPAIPRFDT